MNRFCNVRLGNLFDQLCEGSLLNERTPSVFNYDTKLTFFKNRKEVKVSPPHIPPQRFATLTPLGCGV